MSDSSYSESAVPQGKLTRAIRLGGIAGSIATEIAAKRVANILSGRKPESLLSPLTAMRAAKGVANMRGAAMKLGQLVSMEAGDFIAPEIANSLRGLRSSGTRMPPTQLMRILDEEWGKSWRDRFARFEEMAFAAASIGQVHRAKSIDGHDLAIKVQFPGIQKSIRSDLDSLSALIAISPNSKKLKQLIAEAKTQLLSETDYVQERKAVELFASFTDNESFFRVPSIVKDLSTDRILAMSFEHGVTLDRLTTAPMTTRSRVITELISHLYKELFAYKTIQTDANFGNFLYDESCDQVVLLDFGAVRMIPSATSRSYKALLVSGMNQDFNGIKNAARKLGLITQENLGHEQKIAEFLRLCLQPLSSQRFDFSGSDLIYNISECAMELRKEGGVKMVPSADLIFIQRKFAGIFLLARKYGVTINVRSILEEHL